MEDKIKSYFEKLKPGKLGLKGKLKVNAVEKLGMGTGNANYLVKVNNKKFVFRLNMDPKNKNKSRKEFFGLKTIEKKGISPKALVLDESRKEFDSDLLILSYIEGIESNKIKPYLSKNMMKNLGKLCGEVHSIKISGKLNQLLVYAVDPKVFYKNLKKEYLIYIYKNIKNKLFLEMIKQTYSNLGKKILEKKPPIRLVLSQGDFCEQNIIVKGNKYGLIDFEDLELTDPAAQVAHIFIDFGKPFDEKQKKIFLNEYFKKYRAESKEEFMKRVESWIPLKRIAVFLWSIWHVLKIKNKELHPHFLKHDESEKNISYVKTIFKRSLREGIIDQKYKNLDLGKVL